MTSSEISIWTCSLVEYSTKRKLQSTRWGGDLSLTRLLLQPFHRLLREYVKPHPNGSLFWFNKIYRKSLFLSKIRKGGWLHVLLQSFNHGMAFCILQTQHRSLVLVHTAPRRWNSTSPLHPSFHLESDTANLSHLLSSMLQINCISC